MGTVADAMEALHALVCHTTFCHQLLRVCCRPMIPCFKPLLLALRLWPIAQLTFGASLVCLATEAYNCSFQHREGLPLSASTTSEVATAGLVDSIRQNCTLDVVCSCLQDALLVTCQHLLKCTAGHDNTWFCDSIAGVWMMQLVPSAAANCLDSNSVLHLVLPLHDVVDVCVFQPFTSIIT